MAKNMTEKEYLEIKYFNERFDRTVNEENGDDIIEMIAAAVHSEAVQGIFAKIYLEQLGYDAEDVGKEGAKFIKEQLKKVQQND